jgi:hypothetical protein
MSCVRHRQMSEAQSRSEALAPRPGGVKPASRENAAEAARRHRRPKTVAEEGPSFKRARDNRVTAA